jgi:sialate O-acetylesterase
VLEADPIYKPMVDQHNVAMKNYPAALEKHKAEAAKAKADGKPEPKAPVSPATNANAVSVLYNGMIAPVLPYTIKGAIWYQGESNAGQGYQYRNLFPMMIQNWRNDWGLGDFPFYFVQLASFQKINKEPEDTNWAVIRESQAVTAKLLRNCGMAVITDYGHESDIHPTPKQPVGERLARQALARTYKQKIEYTGPVLAEAKVDGNKIILRFTHSAGALQTAEFVKTDVRPNGAALRVKPDSAGVPLAGFTLAGEDRKFHNADAKIDGDTVVVSCEAVAKPVAVRYGWANYPLGNLFNKEGLPASPFRTDNWPVVTQPAPVVVPKAAAALLR